jgi:hypothetical protein
MGTLRSDLEEAEIDCFERERESKYQRVQKQEEQNVLEEILDDQDKISACF